MWSLYLFKTSLGKSIIPSDPCLESLGRPRHKFIFSISGSSETYRLETSFQDNPT